MHGIIVSGPEIEPQAILVVVTHLDAAQIQVFSNRLSAFGIAVAQKFVDLGPTLILKHTLRVQLIGFNFDRHAHFSHVDYRIAAGFL